MRKHYIRFLFLIGIILIVSACGKKQPPAVEAQHTQHTAPNGDLREKTASLQNLPTFLNDQREEIRTAYRLAAQHTDVLQWIPCYCGCGQSAGHKSNRNCFIKEIGSDGSVVWDDHGTRCGVCMEIAVISAQLTKQGKTAKEIRAVIDENYKKGYAAPTPTPIPL